MTPRIVSVQGVKTPPNVPNRGEAEWDPVDMTGELKGIEVKSSRHSMRHRPRGVRGISYRHLPEAIAVYMTIGLRIYGRHLRFSDELVRSPARIVLGPRRPSHLEGCGRLQVGTIQSEQSLCGGTR